MDAYYEGLKVFGAIAVALIAIISLVIQTRRARFSMGVDLLLKLDERFDSDRFRKLRQSAAKSLMAKKSCGELDEVLDFFEMMALLVHRRALDKKMIWHNFYHAISGYCGAAKEYIEQERANDDTVWNDLLYLCKCVNDIEKKERKRSGETAAQSVEEIDAFLYNESTI